MTNYNEGLHLCRVTRQGWLETKKEPRRPMLVFAFQVLAEIHYEEGLETFEELPVTEEEETARLLIDVNNEVTLNYGLQKLRYAGFNGDSFAELNLVGQEVRCINRHEHYNGRLHDTWDLALPPLDLRPLDPITPDVARRLDALFGARLKEDGTNHRSTPRRRRSGASPRGNGPESQTAETAATTADNKDLPF